MSEVVIVGASASGLAVAACLKARGVTAELIEKSDAVGAPWRAHYERLHLHTSKGVSALPGLPFPSEYPRYPSRAQFVDYLESYQKHFGLEPSFGEEITNITRVDSGWSVTSSRRTLAAKQVVIATGLTRVPSQPSFLGQELFRGEILHSSRYKNGAPWKGKRVLVVGFGNSGGEVAIDLHEHGATPAIAVRSAVNVIPRDLLGLPLLVVGVLFQPLPVWLADILSAPLIAAHVGSITAVGLRKLPYGPMEQIKKYGRVPLIDVGTLRLAREKKLRILPGIERFTERGVVFEGGEALDFDAVVLATGYRPALEQFLPRGPRVL